METELAEVRVKLSAAGDQAAQVAQVDHHTVMISMHGHQIHTHKYTHTQPWMIVLFA